MACSLDRLALLAEQRNAWKIETRAGPCLGLSPSRLFLDRQWAMRVFTPSPSFAAVIEIALTRDILSGWSKDMKASATRSPECRPPMGEFSSDTWVKKTPSPLSP